MAPVLILFTAIGALLNAVGPFVVPVKGFTTGFARDFDGGRATELQQDDRFRFHIWWGLTGNLADFRSYFVALWA
jgi:hypothetical protein